MNRPRAADDFAAIRTRLEELRRERAPASAEPQARPEPPRSSHTTSTPRPLPPATHQKLFRQP